MYSLCKSSHILFGQGWVENKEKGRKRLHQPYDRPREPPAHTLFIPCFWTQCQCQLIGHCGNQAPSLLSSPTCTLGTCLGVEEHMLYALVSCNFLDWGLDASQHTRFSSSIPPCRSRIFQGEQAIRTQEAQETSTLTYAAPPS